MTVPSYFNTAFDWVQGVGSTDVQDVIDAIVTSITATLPVGSRWTALGGGVYKSPPQEPAGANRFMTVTLARNSATEMAFHVKNQSGATVRNGTIDFTTSMSWRVWAGPYHIFVEFEYGGTPTYEHAIAVFIDPTPFGYQSLPFYTAAFTNRDSGGNPDTTNRTCSLFMNDVAGNQNRIVIQGQGLNTNFQTTGGRYVTLPAEVSVYIGAVWYGGGNLYQTIVLSESIPPKTVVTVPLDSGTTGQFQVLGRIPNSNLGANYAGYIAIRVG